jgi:hypothetical protein
MEALIVGALIAPYNSLVLKHAPGLSPAQARELSMARLFELRSHDGDGDLVAIVDLDKVCLVRVEKAAGHYYERIQVRFVDGHEDHTIVPPQAAQRFIDAYREHLGAPSRD